MMLSVSRHSSRRVKFWLFENYLSPSFKQSAAVMAQQFDFEVRLYSAYCALHSFLILCF